jgi:hypothetical protein
MHGNIQLYNHIYIRAYIYSSERKRQKILIIMVIKIYLIPDVKVFMTICVQKKVQNKVLTSYIFHFQRLSGFTTANYAMNIKVLFIMIIIIIIICLIPRTTLRSYVLFISTYRRLHTSMFRPYALTFLNCNAYCTPQQSFQSIDNSCISLDTHAHKALNLHD